MGLDGCREKTAELPVEFELSWMQKVLQAIHSARAPRLQRANVCILLGKHLRNRSFAASQDAEFALAVKFLIDAHHSGAVAKQVGPDDSQHLMW